jgi:FkbM family methyltransferase
MLKNAIRHLANLSVAASDRTALGRHLHGEVINSAMSRTQNVTHGGSNLVFAIPNALSKYRADSFSIKEPETLEWLDALPHGAVLWDIGANVGIYSCYAAVARGSRVFAFEPSVFNLELLARNIYLNKLADRITVIPLPLAEELSLSRLNMTSTDWGAALSTFGQAYGHDGEPMQKVFEFPTIGLSMVDAVKLLNVPQPDYIKMDVDGIEHLILKGGIPVLRAVKGILIEINDAFTAQAEDARRYLSEAGLSMKQKKHADCFDTDSGAAKYTFNQIWAQ